MLHKGLQPAAGDLRTLPIVQHHRWNQPAVEVLRFSVPQASASSLKKAPSSSRTIVFVLQMFVRLQSKHSKEHGAAECVALAVIDAPGNASALSSGVLSNAA